MRRLQRFIVTSGTTIPVKSSSHEPLVCSFGPESGIDNRRSRDPQALHTVGDRRLWEWSSPKELVAWSCRCDKPTRLRLEVSVFSPTTAHLPRSLQQRW